MDKGNRFVGRDDGRSTAYLTIKWILVVVMALDVIAVIIMTPISLAALEEAKEQTGATDEQMRAARIIVFVFLAIVLIINVIMLIGVVKENFCLVITAAVLTFLGALGMLGKGQVVSGIFTLVMSILCFVFGAMIRRKAQFGPATNVA